MSQPPPPAWKALRQWAVAGTSAAALLGPATLVARTSPLAAMKLMRRWARLQLNQLGISVTVDDRSGFDGKRESSWRRGDPDKALTEAPIVIDQTYSTPVETHNPMEMHGTVAVWDGDNVTLYECTQGVVNHRTVMSEVLGVPRGTIKSRLHAAVRALRESLAREDGESR